MSGEVAPNGRADEHQQGGRQRHGEGKHQVGRREREENDMLHRWQWPVPARSRLIVPRN